MKNTFKILFLSALAIFSFSCDVADDIIKGSTTDTTKIANGLKEALKVGTDSSVTRLNKADGYFKDAIVKILLPDELEKSISTFKSKKFNLGLVEVTGEQLYKTGYKSDLLNININPLQSKEDDLILGMNRAAEAAAKDAKPIFVDAITSMTIVDATNILFGGVDTAATSFLRKSTYNGLFTLFEPKMENALQTVAIAGKPVSTTYEEFVADYNKILNTSVGFGTISSLSGVNTVKTTDLSSYATGKGLKGLFIKVADQELLIRKDPFARVTDLLRDVFGELDKK